MIRITACIALASALSFTSPVHAQDFFAANTQVLVGEENTVSAEYSWAEDNLSGYGFVDKSLDTGFFITYHEVKLDVTGPLYVSSELGYNRFGGETGNIGVGVRLGSLPVIRGSFEFMNIYAQHTVFGPNAHHIVGVAWTTKDVHLTDEVSVYSSGFADFKHEAQDVIQPQVWMRFENSPVEVGTEVSIFGNQTSVSAAVKFNF